MPQATPAPESLSVPEAAAAIVRLINSSPRSPRLEEIEAIVAKAVPAVSGAAPASPLLTRIRQTAARLEGAFEVHAKVTPGDPVEGAADDRVQQIEAELEDLEGQIPSPPQSFADLVAWAEIARAGGDIGDDGTLGETQAPDVFARPAARLVEAVLQFGGSSATRWTGIDFEPVINPETGKPLSFDYTNDAFARSFLPSIRLAFIIMGSDREGVAEFVRGLTTDSDDPEAATLFKLLDNWKIVQNKFEAIALFAQSASARVMAVGMAVGERQTEGAAQ